MLGEERVNNFLEQCFSAARRKNRIWPRIKTNQGKINSKRIRDHSRKIGLKSLHFVSGRHSCAEFSPGGRRRPPEYLWTAGTLACDSPLAHAAAGSHLCCRGQSDLSAEGAEARALCAPSPA